MEAQTLEAPHVAGLGDDDRRQILAMPGRHGPQTMAADWAAMNEDYTDDVLVMMPGLPDMCGRAALRAFQESFPRVIASELHITELGGCGDVAYARMSYRYQVEAGGSTVEDTGRAIWILRKGVDGRWRVALDISNSDVAPAPGGEP